MPEFVDVTQPRSHYTNNNIYGNHKLQTTHQKRGPL